MDPKRQPVGSLNRLQCTPHQEYAPIQAAQLPNSQNDNLS